MRISLPSIVLAALIAVAMASCGGPGEPPAAPGQAAVPAQAVPPADVYVPSLAGKNLVLLVVDSLRADHLAAYGADLSRANAIDEMAAGGIAFERACANSSFIGQSLSALMTGRLPTAGGTIGLLEAHPLDVTETLPQKFARAGYYTGIVSNQPRVRGNGLTKGYEDVQIGPANPRWPGDDAVRRALTFVEDAADDPFMLYLHLGDLQQPVPGDPAAEESALAYRAQYEEQLAVLDAAVKVLIDGLGERGHAEDTVIVLTSPHGVELGDHGYAGDGWTLYEESVRVPLIICAPGTIEPGRFGERVTLVNLAPTLLALFEIDGFDHTLDGEILAQAEDDRFRLLAPQNPQMAELIIPERAVLRAVWRGDWKYTAAIAHHPPSVRAEVARSYAAIALAMSKGEQERPPLWGEPVSETLYDLSADPLEQRDAMAENGDVAAELRGLLDDYREYCEGYGLQARDVDRLDAIDPDDVEDLESLGYL